MSDNARFAESSITSAHQAGTGSALEAYYLKAAQVSAILALADAVERMAVALEGRK